MTQHSSAELQVQLLKAPKQQNQLPTASGDIEIPVTQVRKAIAKNMLRSTHEIPHAWMMMEVDVTELVNTVIRLKMNLRKKKALI